MIWLMRERRDEDNLVLSSFDEYNDYFKTEEQAPPSEPYSDPVEYEVDMILYKAVRRLCRACNSQVLRHAFETWQAMKSEHGTSTIMAKTGKYVLYSTGEIVEAEFSSPFTISDSFSFDDPCLILPSKLDALRRMMAIYSTIHAWDETEERLRLKHGFLHWRCTIRYQRRLLSFTEKIASSAHVYRLKSALSTWKYTASHTIPERITMAQSHLAIRTFGRFFARHGILGWFQRWKLRVWATKTREEGSSHGLQVLFRLARRWVEGRLKRGFNEWRKKNGDARAVESATRRLARLRLEKDKKNLGLAFLDWLDVVTFEKNREIHLRRAVSIGRRSTIRLALHSWRRVSREEGERLAFGVRTLKVLIYRLTGGRLRDSWTRWRRWNFQKREFVSKRMKAFRLMSRMMIKSRVLDMRAAVRKWKEEVDGTKRRDMRTWERGVRVNAGISKAGAILKTLGARAMRQGFNSWKSWIGVIKGKEARLKRMMHKIGAEGRKKEGEAFDRWLNIVEKMRGREAALKRLVGRAVVGRCRDALGIWRLRMREMAEQKRLLLRIVGRTAGREEGKVRGSEE